MNFFFKKRGVIYYILFIYKAILLLIFLKEKLALQTSQECNFIPFSMLWLCCIFLKSAEGTACLEDNLFFSSCFSWSNERYYFSLRNLSLMKYYVITMYFGFICYKCHK